MGLAYNLFPLYCTAPAVSTQLVNDLLYSSASDPYVTPPAEFALVQRRDPNKLPVQILTEAKKLPAHFAIHSDFIGQSTRSIAAYTAWRFATCQSGCSSSISVVLDDKSARDRTCIVVKAVRENVILQVRIPFSLAGCLFGVHTGLGLAIEDMMERADSNGVFNL